MIKRAILDAVKADVVSGKKIVILYGARQVGKTTLVREILNDLPFKALVINADQLKYNEVLSSRDLRRMQELIDDHALLFIDEAQNIPNIGINLKILHDSLPELRIIATGSSSFELANQLQEPLTGRTRTYRLFPISISELRADLSPFELKDRLNEFLLYGLYPEVLQLESPSAKREHLQELSTAYLYKDILQLSNIKHSDKIFRLLKLLALQVGSLVSVHELAKSLEMSHETVNSYIDLLEKGFIVFRLGGYSRNMRKEITKMNKIYFYDTGIRNTLAEAFQPLDARADKGALWENFLVAERRKKLAYERIHGGTYFWRTYTGVELDYVEERDDQLHGFEFKWKPVEKKAPNTWTTTYQHATFRTVHTDNFLEFVL